MTRGVTTEAVFRLNIYASVVAASKKLDTEFLRLPRREVGCLLPDEKPWSPSPHNVTT